ncbi:FGGY-family carbohydrate kinase [Aquabacterium sp. OR-4]|uniref:FGGY-family carbohydrate kinase n=1 Tax=Aquabacterium sp. OR-4 TaxID=2978127 RepID=UPI0028C6CF46|nr:L-fuculose kinase [Aquabacterium sp. OR-4]MDT7838906.1 L-fuculose kinase [Aquabacterium sp. OR-4]
MSEGQQGPGAALDLVLDIGKTRSKLLVIDRAGAVLAQSDHASGTQRSGPWAALDTAGIEAWLCEALAGLGARRSQLARAVVSAHGAAFAAVQGEQLCWPVPDYEFEGFDERPADWAAQIGPFEQTHSPDLPRGLNAATQFDWLERHAPAQFAQGQLLPYAQYWAWWLSGVAASEVSSLGCHTHLWDPLRAAPSALAQRRGWAARLAPMRRAWEVLGLVRPALAQRLGLPRGLRVHAGVHDSNACLTRYLRSHPRMTLVTTGTWVVVMAPGATQRALQAELDLLSNVSVRNEPVPTGRFMGGRELQQLCAGADPALATLGTLQQLLQRGVMALPGFETQGGPFRRSAGSVCDAQGPLALDSLSPAERATLAGLYTAQVTAWIIGRLGGVGPTVVEGPFSRNPVFTAVLASLLGGDGLSVSVDPLEGTARGAWMLAHWTEPAIASPAVLPADPLPAAAQAQLLALHGRWCERATHAASLAQEAPAT